MRASHAIVVTCLLVILLGLSSRVGMSSAPELYLKGGSINKVPPRPVLASSSVPLHQSARTPGSSNGESGASLSLSVDGQLNPEQIPDHVAYRHFISVTAVSSGASEAEIYRRDAILVRVGLSEADRRAYLAIINVRDELLDTEQKIQAVHHDIAAIDDLRLQKASVLDNAATRILSSLSADGVESMQTHINDRIKKHIRIYSQVQ